MRTRLAPLALGLFVLTAACGGKSPTAPAGTASGSAAGMATINGNVKTGVVSAALADATGPLAGVTVTIPGTSIASGLDAAGGFMLINVPPGSVQLRIAGGGTDATVSLSDVQPSQTVTVSVVVSGSSAAVDTELRSGAGADELEGRVESLPPTMPALAFKAAGRIVQTSAATQFSDSGAARTFSDLQIGIRVHARGHLVGDTFNADSVELQNTNGAIPVELNGVIDSLSGTAAAFQFNIGSHVIKGDSATVFFGDGDTPDTFADLKDGVRVEVKGQQKDGYVYAVRVHINDGTDDPTQDDSASIHGVLKTIGSSAPNLVLTVDTTTVRTSSATTVKRRGDVQTLDALKVGQSLHVVGARRSDGSIDARLIEIDDDQTGGEFEIEGALGGLSGTCPTIRFTVNGFSIATSGSTTFEGAACTALKSGDQVDVKGTRNADGSVAATNVKKS